MSQTATAKNKGFREASAPRLATLVCTGYVAAVTDGKESSSGNYNIVKVDIQGLGGSRNATIYPCTRPEWFATDEEGNSTFRPDSLDKVEGGKSIKFVYAQNISQKDGTSTFQGLCGSDERFEALQDALLSDPATSDEVKSDKAIERILDDILVAKQGDEAFEIGYVLKQGRSKTGRKNEEGKDEYVYTKNYEVSEFFEATDKNKAKYRKIAEKSAKKAEEAGETCYFRVTFDEGAPF